MLNIEMKTQILHANWPIGNVNDLLTNSLIVFTIKQNMKSKTEEMKEAFLDERWNAFKIKFKNKFRCHSVTLLQSVSRKVSFKSISPDPLAAVEFAWTFKESHVGQASHHKREQDTRMRNVFERRPSLLFDDLGLW